MGNWLKSTRVLNDEPTMMNDRTQQNSQITNHSTQNYRVDAVQSMASQSLPVYYPVSYTSSLLVSQLAEEEQIQIAKRIGLIQHLPTGTYDGGGSSKKSRECVICMIEFSKGDSVRFLPCMHHYHATCIDDWLIRSFTCPSCMEPVDVALLNTF